MTRLRSGAADALFLALYLFSAAFWLLVLPALLFVASANVTWWLRLR